MSTANECAGLAALSICEALLLAMNDCGLLPESEIVGVLRDAAASHANAAGTELETETDRAVAELINAIIAGGNSVRKPRADRRAALTPDKFGGARRFED